eukprot:gene34006-biopygen1509
MVVRTFALHADTNIGPEGAKALAFALTPNEEGAFNTSLNTLDLLSKTFPTLCFAFLSTFVNIHDELGSHQLLRGAENGIGPEGAKALAIALAPNENGVFNRSLNTLNLEDNQLCGVDLYGRLPYDASGIKALADALALNGTLHTLTLADNELCNPRVATLGSEEDDPLSRDGISALATALVLNKSLDTLDVRGTNITGKDAEKLAEAVLKHPSLQVFNKIAMQDMRDDKLTELDLSDKNIGVLEALVLSKLLVFNGSVKTVNLKGNQIGPEGAKALAAALTPNEQGAFNGSLNTLDLGGRPAARPPAPLAPLDAATAAPATAERRVCRWSGLLPRKLAAQLADLFVSLAAAPSAPALAASTAMDLWAVTDLAGLSAAPLAAPLADLVFTLPLALVALVALSVPPLGGFSPLSSLVPLTDDLPRCTWIPAENSDYIRAMLQALQQPALPNTRPEGPRLINIRPAGSRTQCQVKNPLGRRAAGDNNLCYSCVSTFGRKQFDPSGISALAAALVLNNSMDTLDVCGNLIAGKDAEKLAEAVLRHPSLQVFNKIAMQDMRDDKLTELDLSDKNIGVLEALVLSKLLVFNGSLNTLILDGNRLAGHRFTGDTEHAECLEALGDALKENATLTSLSMCNNMLGPKCAAALAEGLACSGSLNTLTLIGERSWYGGRLGEGASVEGATVIEYLDGNPEREEVFLEDRPRGPGKHDGFLSRRGGGRRVAVRTVDGWSREAEKGLLMGWRRLPRGDAGAGAGGETEGVSGEDGATGVGGLAGGMAVGSGEGVEGPHLSLRLELSGSSGGVSDDLGGGAVAARQSGGEEAVRVAGEDARGAGLGTATVGAERRADAAGAGGAVEPLGPFRGVSGGTGGVVDIPFRSLDCINTKVGVGAVWLAMLSGVRQLRGETAVGSGAILGRRGGRMGSAEAGAWCGTRMGLERRDGHGGED